MLDPYGVPPGSVFTGQVHSMLVDTFGEKDYHIGWIIGYCFHEPLRRRRASFGTLHLG